MTDIIQELRSLIAKATPGPWETVETKIPWSIASGKQGNHTERRIATTWDHPQSRAPSPVVTGSVGLGFDGGPPAHLVHISKEDAALIVAAINHLPALLDRLEAAERVIDFLDMRRPIKGIERRSNEEVFAIMADRIRLAEAGHYRLPSIREVKP
ncbi:hypothetical protein [Sphingobium yanoikuyae]|uniref:Uncharacterized protein n=1 Tax=Sphingobium yanoikuyae TaxID=13690 RepID=A0A430BZD6_SPHYA|nr:hypothetical protein [Sphingobium yanoikuyae]RSU58052.1 hypothetical protein DAH51_07355 [Sphingobium yanoikuyae]